MRQLARWLLEQQCCGLSREATLKDAFGRMRGADVEQTLGLDELDARDGAWIECAIRADAAICRST